MMRRLNSSLFAAVAVIGLASVASAADMPMKAPAAAPPVYNWGGWYVGGNIGYGWGVSSDPSLSFVDVPTLGFGIYYAAGGNVTPDVSPRGVIGGGQVGYNWMVSPNWMAGLVADFQGSGVKRSGSNTVNPTGVASIQSNSVQTDWFGTVRARLGWTRNNWMVYATGGAAYGHVEASGASTFFTAPALPYTGSNSTTRFGWAAGAGLDYGLTPNWIVGVEYLYVDLGHISYTETPATALFPTTSITISNRAAMHIGRLTASYKF